MGGSSYFYPGGTHSETGNSYADPEPALNSRISEENRMSSGVQFGINSTAGILISSTTAEGQTKDQ
jgi:hypothetical protein